MALEEEFRSSDFTAELLVPSDALLSPAGKAYFTN